MVMPAPNGTMKVIGFSGYLATADYGNNMATAAKPVNDKHVRFMMSPSDFCKDYLSQYMGRNVTANPKMQASFSNFVDQFLPPDRVLIFSSAELPSSIT